MLKSAMVAEGREGLEAVGFARRERIEALEAARNDYKVIQVTELREAPRAHGTVCAERLKMDRTAQTA